MNTAAIEQTLYLLDRAFAGTEWHSLLGNLRSVTAEDWLWVPPEGKRSIRDIVQHVGGCKFMYENHAFGDGHMTWDDAEALATDAAPTIEAAVAWLQAGQAQWRASIAALEEDAELLRPRRNPADVLKETRWIIATMIEHDLYHAGEINHLRCLHQQNDE